MGGRADRGRAGGAAMTPGRGGGGRLCPHRLAARDPDPGATDRDLLRRYADARDPAAFEALVRRHAALVLATGRRVLGDPHGAEDVCQAAFALLARKAGSCRWGPSVAGWL